MGCFFYIKTAELINECHKIAVISWINDCVSFQLTPKPPSQLLNGNSGHYVESKRAPAAQREASMRRTMRDGEKHNRSMDDVLDMSQEVIDVSPIAPQSATTSHAPAPPMNGHSNNNESFELHSASFEGGAHLHPSQFTRAHLTRHSTTRRHHNKYKRVVKSQSEHGNLRYPPKALSVASYGLGSVSSSRVLSPNELEFLRRSQIFNLLRGKPHFSSLTAFLLSTAAFLELRHTRIVINKCFVVLSVFCA